MKIDIQTSLAELKEILIIRATALGAVQMLLISKTPSIK
jgi:hypothetical protein